MHINYARGETRKVGRTDHYGTYTPSFKYEKRQKNKEVRRDKSPDHPVIKKSILWEYW